MTSSGAWWKSERLVVPRLAGAATPQFPAVLRRPKHLHDRHLDDPAGDKRLVYRLTHSSLLLGIVSFAGQIVAFLVGPVAGVWVERLDRRKLLVWTQAAGAVQSLALAVLTLAQVINLWEIMALAALQGLINAFDMPARQSFLMVMVDDRNDLSNAIAINSSMANGARLIGPAIAGLVIAAVGEGWCFLIDGVSYFAVIASLLLMRVRLSNVARSRATMLEQVREGWGLRQHVPAYPQHPPIVLLFSASWDGRTPYCCRCSPARYCMAGHTLSAGLPAPPAQGP